MSLLPSGSAKSSAFIDAHIARMRAISDAALTAHYGHSSDIKEYLRKKIEYYDTIKPAEGHEWFDPSIRELDAIPFCATCKENYQTFKDAHKAKPDGIRDAEMDHTRSCLWYDYFVRRIRVINPDIRIVTRTKTPAAISKPVKHKT
jgi:hypothetical protein